ncbi:MAG: amidohydrolase family protein [Clostridia bacterium]|nr:amidohydrolase family protein [Clostridia bacterium]
MKIYDLHVHACIDRPYDRDAMLAALDEAGIFGACVFSERPPEVSRQRGISFEARLEQLAMLTEGAEERLFPVIWAHPYERGIAKKLLRAKEAGVVAVKVMPCNFYIEEKKSMRMMREIAALGLPVIFHSGILWDNGASGKYTRPVNYEPLLEVENLRFSMGHCSWPWVDECIAMYGKFNWARHFYGRTAEMFFDITPGTPAIYRRDLLTKLHNVGYPAKDNILFGTDHVANSYDSKRARAMIEQDNAIYDELGISEETRAAIYRDNLARFLGKELSL